MVVRINKTRDYTVMSNHHFKDKRLSLKAKGLLSQMLSLPDNWDYTVAGLCAINKENETAITSALDELKRYGYLVVTKLMPNETDTGRIGYAYDIYEQPLEKQDLENQPLEIQDLENHGQLNKEESKTKEVKTKKLNTKDIIREYTDDDELAEALEGFSEMRRSIKKPLTTRAWKIIFTKLEEISPTREGKIACLNQSIEHSWQSVYPVKETGLKTKMTAQERLGWIDDI